MLEHHVGFEEHHRRDQHAGDRADRRRHAPAERDHPADPDADEPRRFRIARRRRASRARCGCSGRTDRASTSIDERHGDHAGVDACRSGSGRTAAPVPNGLGNGLDGEVPDEAGEAVEDREQRDEDHDVAQHRRVVDRLEARSRSITTPAANEIAIVMQRRRPSRARPIASSCQAMKVENIAISPCAKLRWSIAW